MKTYKHLFFDLDRTLWDFEANSLITLQEIFKNRQLKEKGIESFEAFLGFYKPYNHQLWDKYKLGEIKKDFLSLERYRGTLKHFNINDDDLAFQISQDYIKISPTKTKLFPDTIKILDILKQKYQLHIITNGFNEVQFVKLKNSGLDIYFDQIITSEMIGIQKPAPQIFEYALKKANARIAESIMIGDDQEVDIMGASNYGLDQIFVNFNKIPLICNPNWEINELGELLDIL